MDWLGIIAVVLVVYFFLQSGKKGKASSGNGSRSTALTPASPKKFGLARVTAPPASVPAPPS